MEFPKDPSNGKAIKISIPLKWLGFYIALFSLWVIGVFTFTSGFREPSDWLGSWVQWDANWYWKIWEEGYRLDDPRALVFPPGYSFVIGALSLLLAINFHTTAIAFNLVCLFVGACISTEFIFRKFNIPRPFTFILTLSAPAAYFVFTTYSDSLFFLLFWVAVALMHSPSNALWVRASQFTLFLALPWIRLAGFALFVWLLLKRWTALALLISLGGWLALNYFTAGDAFYFLKAQELFSMPQGSLLDGFTHSFNQLVAVPNGGVEQWTPYLQFSLLPIVYFTLIAGLGAWFCWKRQWLLGLSVLALLCMTHNQAFWRSTIRYNLPLAPLLLVFMHDSFEESAKPSGRLIAGFTFGALIVVQLAMQLYFAIQFKSGQWAF